MKPYKLAYQDLIGMSKAAATRLEAAVEATKKRKADAVAVDEKAPKRGRPRKNIDATASAPAVDNQNASSVQALLMTGFCITNQFSSLILGVQGPGVRFLVRPGFLQAAGSVGQRIQETRHRSA